MPTSSNTPTPLHHSSFSIQNSPLPPFRTLFPPNHLTLLLGDPGTGKSLLATDLAARVTRGLNLCGHHNHRHEAAFLSREDHFNTLINRFLSAD